MSTERTLTRRESRLPRGGAAGPRRFRPDIQGLRAIAVGLVVAYHAGVPQVTGGFIGVDVFFVISGFLMTGKLSRMLDGGGRVRFGEFYSSRVRRILPVAFVVIAATVAGSLVVAPPLRFLQIVQEAIATSLYVPNILFAVQGTTYLGSHDASPFQQYWSLGVEEQFYLVWPLLLAGLWALARRSSVRVASVLVILIVISFIASVIMTGTSQPWAFFGLPTRAWELGVGAFVALIGKRALLPAGPVAALIGWLGLVGIVTGALSYDDQTLYPGSAALLPVMGTALVIWAGARQSRGDPTLVLRTAPFRFIGDISYSIYLWHWPLLVLPAIALGTPSLPVRWKLLLAAASIGLAVLSYRFVERPFQDSRRVRGWTVRRSMAFALVTAVVLGAASYGAGQIVSRSVTGSASIGSSSSPSSPPDFAKTVPANLTPGLLGAAQDVPVVFAAGYMRGDPAHLKSCVYGDVNGSVTWAMFGDSHMANWMPGTDLYAKAHGIRLVVFGKTSCPVSDVTPVVGGAPFVECEQWRKLVIQKLTALRPAVILMGDSAVTAIQAPDGRVLTVPVGNEVDLWDAGLETTVKKLPRTSKIVFIADSPYFATTPAECLSANPEHVSRCSEPRSSVLPETWNAGLARTMAAMGGSYLDMSDYLCTASVCGAIEGKVLLYSDNAHISNTGGLYLARVFGGKLTESVKTARTGSDRP